MDNVEEPGEFFHPLLGTLITGAARLMLAIAERLIADAGLTWAFCDTDSMAIGKPAGMDEREFFQKAEAVRNWFKPLNPYAADVELFKIEDANRRIVDGKPIAELEPLYCLAVSSKRYALFNLDGSRKPIIRKATAHGLGHLLQPYWDEETPADLPAPAVSLKDIGVRRWQHDLWNCIIRSVLAGNPNQPDFSELPNFDRPAVSQYAVTTTRLSKWFDPLNRGKPYSQQVRPFNFMLMFQPKPLADWAAWRLENGLDDSDPTPPCVIAPYDSDLSNAPGRRFDRDTGLRVGIDMLKAYREALAQYHMRPEAKFLNANYCDRGETQRRHVEVASILHIGKEANRWEEQSHIGIDPQAEINYGLAQLERDASITRIKAAVRHHRVTYLATAAHLSRQHLAAIISGRAAPGRNVLTRLRQAAEKAELDKYRTAAEWRRLSQKIKRVGVRKVAVSACIDAGHLTRLLNAKRKPTYRILDKIRAGMIKAQ